MAKKNDTDKLSELLASFNGDLLKEDAPQYFNDDSIRVERILLDMVRPDPIQPRRVLPEKIHLAFHENRLTPSQALREMVQVANGDDPSRICWNCCPTLNGKMRVM
jgi:hypothetical protein